MTDDQRLAEPEDERTATLAALSADVRAYLEFAIGGTPSRFMRHEADWERVYRVIEYVASLPPAGRPSEETIRAAVFAALPRRDEWAEEIVLAYRHGLALLDRRED